MNDGNNNDDEINGTLNKSLSYSIDSQEIEEDIINAITEKNEIKKNVVEKLLHFYIFQEKLHIFTKRKYNDFEFNFFWEYFPINPKWIRNYLLLYNYKKISKLIRKQTNGQLIIEDLYNKIRNKSIFVLPGENDKRINNLKWIEFSPKKEEIPKEIYYDEISEKTIQYFNDFILVDKEIYDEIKQDPSNGYIFNIENKVNICIVDNIFIYKIEDNILGFGILTELSDFTSIPIFHNQFLIILNDEDGCDLNDEIFELFTKGDLEKYLIESRGVKFNRNNNKIIDFYKEGKKIGTLYNISNFTPEIYWKRNKEKYKEKLLEIKREEEIKKQKELEIRRKAIREEELKQMKKIEEIKRQNELKKNIEKERLKEEQNKILKIIEYNYYIKKVEEEKVKELIRKDKNKKLNKFNNIYIDDLPNEYTNDNEIIEKIEIEHDNNRYNIKSNDIQVDNNVKTFSNINFNPIYLSQKEDKTNTCSLPNILSNTISNTNNYQFISMSATTKEFYSINNNSRSVQKVTKTKVSNRYIMPYRLTNILLDDSINNGPLKYNQSNSIQNFKISSAKKIKLDSSKNKNNLFKIKENPSDENMEKNTNKNKINLGIYTIKKRRINDNKDKIINKSPINKNLINNKNIKNEKENDIYYKTLKNSDILPKILNGDLKMSQALENDKMIYDRKYNKFEENEIKKQEKKNKKKEDMNRHAQDVFNRKKEKDRLENELLRKRFEQKEEHQEKKRKLINQKTYYQFYPDIHGKK